MRNMKKTVLLFAALACTAMFAACGNKPAAAPETPAVSQSAMEALPGDASPAQTIIADFQDKAGDDAFASLDKLAEALSKAEYLPFDGASMQVEPGYLNGFTKEIEGFKDGYMFGPVIGSIPFIAYVFETEDEKAAGKLMTQLSDTADLRWNICTQADEMRSVSVGNRVVFVMAPASFEE